MDSIAQICRHTHFATVAPQCPVIQRCSTWPDPGIPSSCRAPGGWRGDPTADAHQERRSLCDPAEAPVPHTQRDPEDPTTPLLHQWALLQPQGDVPASLCPGPDTDHGTSLKHCKTLGQVGHVRVILITSLGRWPDGVEKQGQGKPRVPSKLYPSSRPQSHVFSTTDSLSFHSHMLRGCGQVCLWSVQILVRQCSLRLIWAQFPGLCILLALCWVSESARLWLC